MFTMLTQQQNEDLEKFFFGPFTTYLFWIGVAGCVAYGVFFVGLSVASGQFQWSVLMPGRSEFPLVLMALFLALTITRRLPSTILIALAVVPLAAFNMWRVEPAVSGLTPQLPLLIAGYTLVAAEILAAIVFVVYCFRLYRDGKFNGSRTTNLPDSKGPKS